uniref:Protein V2 n=1 Tax=Tomato leaf curl Gujarat virus TaxID=219299 RepID=A0A2S1ZWE3_9GEMI|nr:pre-coat protein [Tomato leaf curl Gujarat virus]
MWDPLVNEFPEAVRGLRCMLAVKYLRLVDNSYFPDPVGYDFIRDLISVIRARNYVEASSRDHHFHGRFEGTPASQLRHPIGEPCCCPHCPRHQSKGMGQRAHVQEAQDLPNVQEP